MFDFQDHDPSLLHLLVTLLRCLFKPADRAGDPDETEIEPNP